MDTQLNILFVHQNFPAQFVYVAHALKDVPGLKLAVVTNKENDHVDFLPTARYGWEPQRAGRPEHISTNFALRVSRGRMAANAMLAIRSQNFVPDVILGHLGWGETLFAKDVFPDARLIVHAEFYYSASGADVGFDPEFPFDDRAERRFELRAKNAAILAAMIDADRAVAPTHWQASRFPAELQHKIDIVHEGIDTDLIAPNSNAVFRIGGTGQVFRPGDEVITFVNRNLEPYRGYHIFMRMLPRLLSERPNAHVIIVGGDAVSYGAAPPQGKSWKQIFLSEVRDRLPMERVHFVGKIPFADFVALMQVSAAHVYLTYPFVLSWSMLQAMSAGAPIIASDTEPVREIIEDGVNGRLVDFFDIEMLTDRVVDVLENPDAYKPMRSAARATIIKKYDLRSICLPRWLDLLGALR